MYSFAAAECEMMKVQNADHNPILNGYYRLMDSSCESLLAWKRVAQQHQISQQATPTSVLPIVYYLSYSNSEGVHGWAIS
jgi:hypothetical protein